MIQPTKILKSAFTYIVLLICNYAMAGDFEESHYNHRIMTVNTGYTFSGSGDCWGINNGFSHLKTFSPWFFHRESAEGWIINGNSWIDGGYENQTGINLTAEIGIAPFKSGERIFYLAGGAALGYISNISPNGGAIYNYNFNGSVQSRKVVNYSNEFYLTPGFTLSAGYITKVNPKIYLNIRAQTTAYNSGDVMSTLSVGIGINALNR
jgi:hypothetical protein